MAITITAANVVARLRSLTTVDVPDAVLATPAYIPAADAWASQIVGSDTLTDNKSALIVAAKIAFVCKRVIASAPVESFDVSILKTKAVTANDRLAMMDILDIEIGDLLTSAGYTESSFYVTSSGGDDYTVDGTDNTQIDYTEPNLTVWP